MHKPASVDDISKMQKFSKDVLGIKTSKVCALLAVQMLMITDKEPPAVVLPVHNLEHSDDLDFSFDT